VARIFMKYFIYVVGNIPLKIKPFGICDAKLPYS
jgi:hypothetical protein